MRLITYAEKSSGKAGAGFLLGDGSTIVPARELGLPEDMNELIRALGESAAAEGKAAALTASAAFASLKDKLAAAGKDASKASDRPVLGQNASLLAPIPHPAQDVVCLGVNYRKHAVETRNNAFIDDVDATKNYAIYFAKRVWEAVPPDGAIDGHTDICDSLDYEAELCVVIGADAKNVSEEEAPGYILGYTILNDMSARNLQNRHKQWYFGKSLDDFTPIGPCIVTADEFEMPPARAIRSRVNGELRQDDITDNLIHSISEVVSELSRGFTLRAGTLIAMGTPSGVGMGFNPPKYLKPGDVIECEIDGIGVLKNTVR